jgi:hypothetical protein
MVFTGESWATYPPGHFHRCNNCGYIAASRGEEFPRMEYEEV